MASSLTTQTTRQIDQLLATLLTVWQEVPDIAAQIDQWDIGEQLTYTEEWGLYSDKLALLERDVAAGNVSAEQQARYDELRTLIRRNRPILERILAP